MPFTPEQQSAILAQNRELLVSAAAGSGKTAVLVARILHMLTHGGLSLDRMLIVTYTRAAAAELRERLETNIADEAKDNPALLKQAELLGSAQISTIHAYCQHVVREHFRDCRIDPQFTVGDERTLNALYQDSMEETLDSVYQERHTHPEYQAITEKYKEKELAQLLELMYRFLVSRPHPLEWLRAQGQQEWQLETMDREPASLAFVDEARLMLQGVLLQWEQAKQLSLQPAFPPPMRATLEADFATLQELAVACGQGLREMVAAFQQCRFITLARTKPVTEDEVRCADRFKELRGDYKKSVDEVRKRLPANLESSVADMEQMRPALRGLALAAEKLFTCFQEKKREQAALDFNDLEHFTLELLQKEDIRAQEAQRFDAVFVDEYQDVSEIQEAILNGIKRSPGQGDKQYFFYVGDVKQSIYRFRLAEPGLFLSKLDAFSGEEGAQQRKIILNKNFRSREGVLNAVNRIFAHLMDRRVTEIDYNREAMLYPGFPSQKDPMTELHVFCSPGQKPADALLAEAEFVARDILALVGQPVLDSGGEPCGRLRFKDVAILLPVVKNVADKVEAVLMRAGIPVYTDVSANAFTGEEVVSATQHLLLLDNLKNDTALIAELRSPLFEFTEQELTQIRLQKPEREASFLDALQAVAATSNGEASEALAGRCAAALALLEEERFLFRSMPPDEYLWDFLMRSGLYAHYGAQPGGKLRQANLRMLCQKAGEYAAQHRDGLQVFLESLQTGATGDSSSPTVINPWEDVVRILSIHKSKGLEFPTVYVMGMGGGIGRRRQTKMISLHGKLGVGLMYRNASARTKRGTLLQSAIDMKEAAQERAERARVLYVAATRPKNRLVLVGSTGKAGMGAEALAAQMNSRTPGVNDLAGVRAAGTYLDWLLQCVEPQDFLLETQNGEVSSNPLWKKEHGRKFPIVSTSFPQKNAIWGVVFHIPSMESMPSQERGFVKDEFSPILLDLLGKARQVQEKSSFHLGEESRDPLSPLPEYTHMPLKLGVTALCLSLREQQAEGLGPEEGPQEETPETKRRPLLAQRPRLLAAMPREPGFLTAGADHLGALKGTATHKLLSMVSLAGVASHRGDLAAYLREERERMTADGRFNAQEAGLVDVDTVAGFFQSAVGGRALRSPEVHREWSFNLRVREPIPTTVQGVIDLCFLENGEWILLDFKTDRADSAEELWEKYGDQLGWYRRALETITGRPVAQAGLYSLSAGEVSFRKKEEIPPKI